METFHSIFFEDSSNMVEIADESVHLVVTSPPYPMVEMWDDLFTAADEKITHRPSESRSSETFEEFHCILDKVWNQIVRVLKPGGIVCINIGDAVRSINGRFQLFPNHSRIIASMIELGLTLLPSIIWRKPANSPTKFMGSGMLPPSAYVTLEHEFILIFRKGSNRKFSDEKEKALRRQSAFFWEERNQWFSDVWMDIRGTSQILSGENNRKRSAAFPLELAYRLICMFSIKHDLVMDPFLGTGTTIQAAMAAGRNSIGIESDSNLKPLILRNISKLPAIANGINQQRLANHLEFVKQRQLLFGPLKHWNNFYGFAVMTRQETDLRIPFLKSITYLSENKFKVSHDDHRHDWSERELHYHQDIVNENAPRSKPRKGFQMKLFPS